MAENLFLPAWKDVDQGELKSILHEHIGGHGQYDNRALDPYAFYLPLAGTSCRVKLTFSRKKQIVAIERGPAFDTSEWERIAADIEKTGPVRFGRDCSFSSFRVSGMWRGPRSGVQILPPPPDAPCAPVEMAEHPFLLEFPVVTSDLWPVTNYRRIVEHRRMTHLLNILLFGSTTCQPRRSRHLWASVPGDAGQFGGIKWVQEFFFSNFGEAVVDQLTASSAEPMQEVAPDAYYTNVGLDGRHLRVPSDLDEMICRYYQLSAGNRAKFNRTGFWMDMASRQWTLSFSAVFASLVIAVETLADKTKRPTERFRDFIEQYAPGAALEARRNEMYDLRSEIIHGDTLMEVDQDASFGWAPPEQNDREILEELWRLTQIALRNWLRNP
jgi:hypothetical protein